MVPRPETPNIRWFIDKWRPSQLKESSAAQEHFLDLCWVLGEPTPADSDKTGESYCFERGASIEGGGEGWADVWKRHHFGWEYKGPDRSLDEAFTQLWGYVIDLENPPLLVVSDMKTFRVHTNWTNTVREVHEFELEDLVDLDTRNILKAVFSHPEMLRPGQTRQGLTEDAAKAFAKVAQALRDRGHDPATVAHFVNRLVFCMFAEDVGLLPKQMFTRLLQGATRNPGDSDGLLSTLFGAMSHGGWFGSDYVDCFNGGLFNDDTALPLDTSDIETVLEAARLDWAQIDPSILGTLFERGLDPSKRSQLGAHYTDREKIAQIVEPVVIQPLLSDWEDTKGEIVGFQEKARVAKSLSARRRQENRAQARLNDFLDRLRAFTVLDPACGSGNFLYIALLSLKDLEHRVQIEAERLGFARSLLLIDPSNVKGIEINPYAAELARVAVWIGHIQWMRLNGYPGSDKPILKPLDNIECRDAILREDGTEPDWPEADAVIGNPPFLGDKLLRGSLGDEYVERMFATYRGRVPPAADLVCYWVNKTCELIASGQLLRAGLVTTNSIRGGPSRRVLESATKNLRIFNARSDDRWVVEGAAVRVSLICLTPGDNGISEKPILDGKPVDEIYPDLTGRTGTRGIDSSKADRLAQNRGVAFMGTTKGGGFEISSQLAHEWLQLPANPNGRSNSDVLRPWINGKDITDRPFCRWIIDFGTDMTESQAALYEAPFEWVKEHVLPARKDNRREQYRNNWWRFSESRPAMRNALAALQRYIATPRTAKHHMFVWRDAIVSPSSAVVVAARDDDTTFGILHSRFHEIWALRLGSELTDRPRYTHTTTFETFPFPEGLTPDLIQYADNEQGMVIARAAREMNQKRERWLNPPEWVKWEHPPVPGFPPCPVPRNEDASRQLKDRTLTKLYNQQPQWLIDAHDRIDKAVAVAYDWPTDISAEDALQALAELNSRRSRR